MTLTDIWNVGLAWPQKVFFSLMQFPTVFKPPSLSLPSSFILNCQQYSSRISDSFVLSKPEPTTTYCDPRNMPFSLNIGSGLVEVAALTTLIGSAVAESLILGARGAAGLPWAVMSIFGSAYVIKACVAACTPAGLRETIGVAHPTCDATLGFASSLSRKRTKKNDKKAVGVLCHSPKVSLFVRTQFYCIGIGMNLV
jgi:hypothetical protein